MNEQAAASNGFLTADLFFAEPFRRRYKVVDLPGGKKARLRNLNEREKLEYEQGAFDPDTRRTRPDARVRLICKCLVDGEGNLLFPDFRPVLNRFMEMDGAITARLWDAAWEHCGFSAEDAKKLAENFEEAPAYASSSG